MLNIVTSSLQLYLIASNTSSYSGSGNSWNDLSPNAYNTTLVGGPVFNTTHFTFDGTTEYIDTNQSLASETFSVGAWFRTSAGGIKMIISKETSVGNPWNYRIWMNGGQINADMSQVVTQASLSSPLTNYNDGAWHYVMFTRDDSNWYLYVDGAQVNTRSDPYVGSVTNSQEVWIGRSAYTAGYQYVGDIAEVFVYDDVLTSAEVLENFDNTKHTYYPPTPTPTPTVSVTATNTPTPTPTNTPTATNTPTVTPTPTSTPYPQIAVNPLLYKSTKFPLWEKSTFVSREGTYSEVIGPYEEKVYAGAIVPLTASQQYYSFDYYAIYPPHTIYSAGAYWYTTVGGFTASYDPNTIVRIGATVNITGSDSGIRAIYR